MECQYLLLTEGLAIALAVGVWIWLKRINITACIFAVSDLREEWRQLQEALEAEFRDVFFHAFPHTDEERWFVQLMVQKDIASTNDHEEIARKCRLTKRARLYAYQDRLFYVDLHPEVLNRYR